MTLTLLEDIPNENIKESWSWDIDRMEEEARELRRKIRLAKNERVKQPTIVVNSPLTNQFYKVYQYRIIDYDKLTLCAEYKEEMSDKEVESFKTSHNIKG